jgi:uncharacterized protein YdaU (DUF1376 family)
MADKADIWMPLYIGDYLADTSHLDAERHGCYLLWMMHYWRKGPLPDDLPALVMMGRLASSNASSIAQALLGEFFTKNGDGHWHQKRQDAEREKWQKKKISAVEKAKKAAEGRWGDAPSNASSTPQAMLQPCPLPLPLPLPITQKQKPSRAKREPKSPDGMKHSPDPRHIACKEEIFKYYRAQCGGEEPEWDGREGAALGKFLNANRKLTAVGMERLLQHRARSDVNHADRPAKWIGSLKSYLNGPLNEFGKPKGAGNGNGLTKGERLKQAAAEAIAELEHDYAVANGTGDAEAGESR